MKIDDLSGQQFGEWKVGNIHVSKNNDTLWECKCSCGNIKFVYSQALKKKKSCSCGCLQRKNLSENKTIHGKSDTRIYNIWLKMKYRCKPTYYQHKYYYDKGITIYDEWLSFEKFYEWAIKNGYKEDLSIDRIDNSKGYSSDNCRWTTPLVQSRNRDITYKIKYKGQIFTLNEFAKIIKATPLKIKKYLKQNYSGDQIEKILNGGVK